MGQQALDGLGGEVRAVIGLDPLRHAPGEDRSAQHQADGLGPRGLRDVDDGASGEDVLGEVDGVAAIDAERVHRARVDHPELVRAADAAVGDRAGDPKPALVGIRIGHRREGDALGHAPALQGLLNRSDRRQRNGDQLTAGAHHRHRLAEPRLQQRADVVG